MNGPDSLAMNAHASVEICGSRFPTIKKLSSPAGATQSADPAVGLFVGVVGDLQRRRVGVERVGIFHHKLARPQHTRAGPRLVALLGLDLVPDLRQVTVGADLLGGKPGHDLLVGNAETHVPLVAVLEAEHLRDPLPATRLLPDLGGVEHRHRDLLAADPVHLLANDGVDLLENPLAKGQVDVDAGGELTDQAGAQHELVTDGGGVGGIVPERGDERARPAHGALENSTGGSAPLSSIPPEEVARAKPALGAEHRALGDLGARHGGLSGQASYFAPLTLLGPGTPGS